MGLLSIAARIAQNPGLPAEAPPGVVSQEQQGQQQQGQQEQVGYIKHEKGKGYCVKSEKNSDWSGGCYPSKGEAEKRLNQVEMFKHMKKGAVTPEDIAHDIRVVAARLANSKSPDRELLRSDLQSILFAIAEQQDILHHGQQMMGQQEQQADWKMTLEDPEGDEAIHIEKDGEHQGQQEETAKAAPGWEPTVKKMKKHKEIDNPYALTNWMDQQGYKPHKK